MPLLHAILLALVQALTEFLPVSSTAHLILVPWLLGWPDHGLLFDIALHLGTLAAVLAYFAKTWIRLLFLAVGKEVMKPRPGEPDYDLYENPRLFLFLVAATMPAGIAGLALKDYVESVFRSPAVIGVMLIAVGLLIAYAEKVGRFRRDLGELSFRDAMVIGCAQAVALIPGTSRSGITMSTAMLMGVTRYSAARFSFLLSSPIILGDYVYLHLGNGRMTCVDLREGKETWRSKPFGKYWSMAVQDERILGLDERGDLLLIDANPSEFRLLDKKRVSDAGESWAHVAVVGAHVLVRDLEGVTAFEWK